MLERVQLCQDPHTEFAFLRESLGVSRIATAKLYVQKAAPGSGGAVAANHWRSTRTQRHKLDSISPRTSQLLLQDEDSEDMDFFSVPRRAHSVRRSSKRSFDG